MADLQSFKQDIQSLVSKFGQDKNHYLQKGYPEAQVRIDFLNPFFDALGWDIENKAHKPPHERDVIVEFSPETSLRPDYNFRINGNTKFFVAAKAPWVPLGLPNKRKRLFKIQHSKFNKNKYKIQYSKFNKVKFKIQNLRFKTNSTHSILNIEY